MHAYKTAPLALLCATLAIPLLPWGHAASVNHTIDDELGDSVTGIKPVYSPSTSWNQGSTCGVCKIRSNDPIDLTQVIQGTWHEAVYLASPSESAPSINISFVGTAVYAYFVVPNTLSQTPLTFINMSFSMDGMQRSTFTHTADPTTFNLAYNQLLFSQKGLDNGKHELLIAATKGENQSIILFDYAIYTVDEDAGMPAVLRPQPPCL